MRCTQWPSQSAAPLPARSELIHISTKTIALANQHTPAPSKMYFSTKFQLYSNDRWWAQVHILCGRPYVSRRKPVRGLTRGFYTGIYTFHTFNPIYPLSQLRKVEFRVDASEYHVQRWSAPAVLRRTIQIVTWICRIRKLCCNCHCLRLNLEHRSCHKWCPIIPNWYNRRWVVFWYRLSVFLLCLWNVEIGSGYHRCGGAERWQAAIAQHGGLSVSGGDYDATCAVICGTDKPFMPLFYRMSMKSDDEVDFIYCISCT